MRIQKYFYGLRVTSDTQIDKFADVFQPNLSKSTCEIIILYRVDIKDLICLVPVIFDHFWLKFEKLKIPKSVLFGVTLDIGHSHNFPVKILK